MSNLDYKSLAVLDAVASSGSFEKAALALGISQSAVSQRIKALEDAAGRLLVVRGTPSMPTGLGKRLVAHYRHIKLMEAALDVDLGRDATLPDVTIAADEDSLATWFGLALPQLLTPPRCQLEVKALEADAALKLVREGALFGCVAASLDSPFEGGAGASSTALGTMRYLCVATPAFAGHWFGDGFSIEAVQLAPAATSERRLLARFLAQHYDYTGPFPHHTMPTALDCITRSVAYGLMPEMLAIGAIESGRLVELAPGRVLDLELAWHAWRIDTPFAQAVSEHIIETARRYLRQPD